MTIVSILAILVATWMQLRVKNGRGVLTRFPRGFVPSAPVAYACALALVPLLLVQAFILVLQVRTGHDSATEWQKLLPLPVFDGHSFSPRFHELYYYAAFLTGLCETGCLAIVAFAVGRDSYRRMFPVLVCATVGLAGISLLTPALATTDPYEYVATSMLGFAAYAPPHGAFDGTAYASIYPHVPLQGVIYGPLWLIFDTLELAFVPTILGKLFVLRLVNVALIGLLAYVLQRAGFSRSTIAALMVNPAVWYYVVLSPHADIEGLVLIASAFLAARRSWLWLAVILVAAAGAVKIPFLIIGAAAFMQIADIRRRMLLWGSATVLVICAALLVPHGAYVHDVARYTTGAQYLTNLTSSGFWVIMAALASFVMFALVSRGRRVTVGPWLFGQLAPSAASWYLLWGLPYALATGSATLLLVSLPVTTMAIDSNEVPLLSIVLVALAVAACVREIARSSFMPAIFDKTRSD